MLPRPRSCWLKIKKQYHVRVLLAVAETQLRGIQSSWSEVDGISPDIPQFPTFQMVQLYLYRLYPRIHGKNYLCARDAFIFWVFFVNCGKHRPEKHRRPVGIRRVPKIANEGLFQDLKSANSEKEAKKSTVKKVSEMPKVSHLSLVMRLIESPVLRNKEVSYLRAAKEAARWDSGLAFSFLEAQQPNIAGERRNAVTLPSGKQT